MINETTIERENWALNVNCKVFWNSLVEEILKAVKDRKISIIDPT